MKSITALISGVIFGVGLSISQMVNPQKVINFLDIFGHWDPSLLFVMIAALVVFSSGFFAINKKLKKPILDEKFYLPSTTTTDIKLVLGAIIFGFGWGLAGLCPGPAMANILFFDNKIFGFIIAMLIGMQCANLINNRKS